MTQPKWIWWGGEKDVNQYVDFLKEFTVDSVDESAEIKISVDSEYALFLNGTILGCCQYDDYPDAKVYDTYQIGKLLKPGKNELRVYAYYQGIESFQYAIGTPGLWFSLKNGDQSVVSDETVLCRKSAQYQNGEMYKITMQVGFGFHYDASIEDNPWENAVESPIETTLSPRPIERTMLAEPTLGKLISQGYFIRKLTEGTVAQQMKSDFLSFRRNNGAELPFGSTEYPYLAKDTEGDGAYMLFDLEQEMAGLFTMTLTAKAGAVVEIAYGEHLDDMRVRSHIGGRNYAVSYICKDGEQTFTHWFKRLAGRYLEIRLRNFGEMTIHGIGLISTDYPLDDEASEFICPDSLHNKIFEISKRTAKLCMHEHYEDCPGREQAIYGGDSRFQMLATYYGFGDYKFPRASLDLLAQHPLGNGQVRMVAPTDTRMVIPSFSLWWILGMKEYAQYSGDLTLAEKHWGLLMEMLTTNLSWEKDGIITPPNEDGFWHFFEWTKGHHPSEQPGSIYQGSFYDEPDFLAGIYHLVFWNAMKNLLELAEMLGKHHVVAEYTPTLKRFAETYCKKFWDEENQAFAAYERKGKLFQIGEYSQIFALYSGICQDEKIKDILFDKLLNNEYPVPAMLSVGSLKYEALLWHKPECAKEVFHQIGTRWGAMLKKGATSFWETDFGAEDFAQGGSLCHGWASIPIYLYMRYVAGIKPDGTLDQRWNAMDNFSAKVTLRGKEVTVEK